MTSVLVETTGRPRRSTRPGLRALRTERSTRLEQQDHVGMEEFGTAMDLYFGGDMEASLALGGQVVGRIDEVKPVAQVIDETMAEFYETASYLARFVAPVGADG